MVQSRVGQGTSFELVLPRVGARVAETAAGDRAAAAVTPGRTFGRVLLVDDDPDFGDMLLNSLERRGYEVSPTQDPLDALEGLREHAGAWDVMITDLTMPGMTGLDLIKAAKALQPELSCILCTGFAQGFVSDDRLNEAGLFALLRKPVDLDELTETIGRAIRSKRVLEGEH